MRIHPAVTRFFESLFKRPGPVVRYLLPFLTILAAMCDGHEIRTVEALERNGELDPIQMGFHERHALQCGFCTPGMLMTTRALLDENPDPTDHEIRVAISGAICRCTGYKNIVSAVRWAAEYEAAQRGG